MKTKLLPVLALSLCACAASAATGDRVQIAQDLKAKYGITHADLDATDPDFVKIYDNLLYGDVLGKVELNDRYKGFAYITTLVSLGINDKLYEATIIALDLGVTPVELKDIPIKLQQAFLAIEDTRFYEHSGIDPIGILRAALVALSNAQATQGASTITQQVARNFFLTRERTIERKLKEIFISWRIEQVLTKDEILELYLNKIALGHRSYGVAAAAQTYYGKELADLTLAEMATIAGLPKAPSTLNPISYPERAKARRHLVLGRMLDLGFITKEEYLEVLPKIMYHLDEPTADPAAVALYFVSQLASQDVKVVLSGEGADEFFGGYNTYRGDIDSGFYGKLPFALRHLIASICKHLPTFKGVPFLIRNGERIEDYYVGVNPVFSDNDCKHLLKDTSHLHSHKDIVGNVFDHVKNATNIQKRQAFDLQTWFIKDILQKGD